MKPAFTAPRNDMHDTVMIDYTNWRGMRSVRGIRPFRIFFDSNEWHPEKQWLLEAVDLHTDSVRTFALENIHSWRRKK